MTGGSTPVPAAPPIYRQVLGTQFDALPAQVRAVHDHTHARRWQGIASITRGRSVLARIIAVLFGLPPGNPTVPVCVDFLPDADGRGETWIRDFGGHRFRSHQSPGRGRNQGMMVERFGPVAFGLQMRLDGKRLYLVPQRWTMFGLPMPHFLLPGGDSFETTQNGEYQFDVELRAPLAGLVVAYKGHLQLAPVTGDKT